MNGDRDEAGLEELILIVSSFIKKSARGELSINSESSFTKLWQVDSAVLRKLLMLFQEDFLSKMCMLARTIPLPEKGASFVMQCSLTGLLR